jgi:hypothetical protein
MEGEGDLSQPLSILILLLQLRFLFFLFLVPHIYALMLFLLYRLFAET